MSNIRKKATKADPTLPSAPPVSYNHPQADDIAPQTCRIMGWPDNAPPYRLEATRVKPEVKSIYPEAQRFPEYALTAPPSTPRALEILEEANDLDGMLGREKRHLHEYNIDKFDFKYLLSALKWWEKTLNKIEGLSPMDRIIAYEEFVQSMPFSEARSRWYNSYPPREIVGDPALGSLVDWAYQHLASILWPSKGWNLPQYKLGDDMEVFNKEFMNTTAAMGLRNSHWAVYRTCFPPVIQKVCLPWSTRDLPFGTVMDKMACPFNVGNMYLLLSYTPPEPNNKRQDDPTNVKDDGHDDQQARTVDRQRGNHNDGGRQWGNHNNNHHRRNGGRNGGRKRFAQQPKSTSKVQCSNCHGFGHQQHVCTSPPIKW